MAWIHILSLVPGLTQANGQVCCFVSSFSFPPLHLVSYQSDEVIAASSYRGLWGDFSLPHQCWGASHSLWILQGLQWSCLSFPAFCRMFAFLSFSSLMLFQSMPLHMLWGACCTLLCLPSSQQIFWLLSWEPATQGWADKKWGRKEGEIRLMSVGLGMEKMVVFM